MDAVSPSTVALTLRLAEFSSSFSLRTVQPSILENAKLAILDCLGVSVCATAQEIGVAVGKFAQIHVSEGICTVWGTAITTNARDAALLNGMLAHGLDFDDRNHSSTYSLAAPLAVAEQNDLSGERLLNAFIVGREVRNSLDAIFADRGSGIGPGAKGWHSNGVLGPIASACAVASVLELDKDTTLAAIGLATGSCGALTRDGGTMAKPFRTGQAAMTGVTSAFLALSGFSADGSALEGHYGYLDALGPLPNEIINALGRDLGEAYNLVNPIRGKQYASCSASHGGLEAMLRLVGFSRIQAENVESISCNLKPYPLVRENPTRGFEGRFSMRFCLAMALIHGDLKPYDFNDENINNPSVRELMRRTRHCETDVLVVTLRDGRRYEEPLKRPTNLSTRDEIEKKFLDCVEGILPKRQARVIMDLVSQIESLATVRQLTHCLRI